ncbi:Probable allantoicase [Seminavis robusta]|uniref:Probable allantoicase n=1 Tax=Seminavis robusta TaxID=568900 RepID=A0A9N8EES3_9STRA|nr:Probable allantoicase [Seminavis robusta]|eukprot:Sro835_g208880.1 Probable allantoicase (483) ;mRNA; f:37426-38972
MTSTSSPQTIHQSASVGSITSVFDIGTVGGNAEAQSTSDTRPAKNVAPPSPFLAEDNTLTNFCSEIQGARVLFATDDWFAAASNLCRDDDPNFDPLAFCEQGKVMDGWETRRRREVGHDWCLIKLAKRTSRIVGVEIDTAHFTGNNVPRISLELVDLSCEEETRMVKGLPGSLERLLHGCVQGTGCNPEEVEQAEQVCRGVSAPWKEILPCTPLQPGYEASRLKFFHFDGDIKNLHGTHLRINYFPDGGVARLRLWGHWEEQDQVSPIRRPPYVPIKTGYRCTVIPHSNDVIPSRQAYEFPELSAEALGGLAVACSNKHYGTPQNLLEATLGKDMGDGWETARHPERPASWKRDNATGLVDSDLMDWCIIQLGNVATDGVARILLDTKHFRGNYPESVQVEGTFAAGENLQDEQVEWFPLVSRCRMAADSEHVFDRQSDQIENCTRKVSHVRVSIYPDGGLSRVRVFAPFDAAQEDEADYTP